MEIVIIALTIIFNHNFMKSVDLAKKYQEVKQLLEQKQDSYAEKKAKLLEKLSLEAKEIDELTIQKDNLKEKLIDQMNIEQLVTLKTDTANVTYSKRTNQKIIDSTLFTSYVLDNGSELKKLIDVKTQDEFYDKVLPRTLSTSVAKQLINNYNKISGKMLPGVQEDITEIITVSNF